MRNHPKIKIKKTFFIKSKKWIWDWEKIFVVITRKLSTVKKTKLRSQQNCDQQNFEHKKTFVEINFFNLRLTFFLRDHKKIKSRSWENNLRINENQIVIMTINNSASTNSVWAHLLATKSKQLVTFSDYILWTHL